MVGYTQKVDPQNTSRAIGLEQKISPKKAVEICTVIRGMDVTDAALLLVPKSIPIILLIISTPKLIINYQSSKISWTTFFLLLLFLVLFLQNLKLFWSCDLTKLFFIFCNNLT